MRTWQAAALAVGLVGAGEGRAEAPRKVVALELFTSQGCSSCPPADRVFEALANDPSLPGGVVPLAFHVPYWNHIGWRDPFSDAAFEERQRAYGAAFRTRQIYTPQLVVNGRAHRVGPHDRATLEEVVRAAARVVPGVLRVKARRDGRKLHVEAGVKLTEDLGPGPFELLAAAYHHAPATNVALGENRGRTLANPFTVRALARIASGAGPKGGEIAGRVTLEMPRDMFVHDVGVAILLQARDSREIVHAGRVAVPRKGGRGD
jgi:hypothetical protein